MSETCELNYLYRTFFDIDHIKCLKKVYLKNSFDRSSVTAMT